VKRTGSGSPSIRMGRFAWWDVRPTMSTVGSLFEHFATRDAAESSAGSTDPVRSYDPSVARLRTTHLFGEAVPAAQRDAAVVIFMNDGEDAGVAWRDASANVSHDG
jgi:hypothetical protein